MMMICDHLDPDYIPADKKNKHDTEPVIDEKENNIRISTSPGMRLSHKTETTCKNEMVKNIHITSKFPSIKGKYDQRERMVR